MAPEVPSAKNVLELAAWINDQLDVSIDADSVRGVRSLWKRKFILKGIMSADDARRAVDLGADAVIVSNHGGRQLDGAASTISVLPDIAHAVGDEIEVLFYGGVRTGFDIVRAMGRGARACLSGRAWTYGFGGQGRKRRELRAGADRAGASGLHGPDRLHRHSRHPGGDGDTPARSVTGVREAVGAATVYAATDTPLGNGAFTHDGRLVVSHHPMYVTQHRVSVFGAEGALSPFPNLAWNTPGGDPMTWLDAVLALRADSAGRIWLADMGTRSDVQPKLVVWETRADALWRVIPLPVEVTTPHSEPNDFVIDEARGKVYIADERRGSWRRRRPRRSDRARHPDRASAAAARGL